MKTPNLKWTEDADCPENVIYTVNPRGYRIPFYPSIDRITQVLTDALIGNRAAWDDLRHFARYYHPEYLATVDAIKEKYGYAD